ncbi:hypothetical protein Tco_0903067 [Tanacetum coccineum]
MRIRTLQMVHCGVNRVNLSNKGSGQVSVRLNSSANFKLHYLHWFHLLGFRILVPSIWHHYLQIEGSFVVYATGLQPVDAQHLLKREMKNEVSQPESGCTSVLKVKRLLSAERSDDNTHSFAKEPSHRQSEGSTINELCERAFSDILRSDEYSKLSGLLLKNFGVVNANQVLDLNAINLKMNNGAYETSPMLYLKDIQRIIFLSVTAGGRSTKQMILCFEHAKLYIYLEKSDDIEQLTIPSALLNNCSITAMVYEAYAKLQFNLQPYTTPLVGILPSKDHEGTNRASTNVKDQLASGDNDAIHGFWPLLLGSLKSTSEMNML